MLNYTRQLFILTVLVTSIGTVRCTSLQFSFLGRFWQKVQGTFLHCCLLHLPELLHLLCGTCLHSRLVWSHLW